MTTVIDGVNFGDISLKNKDTLQVVELNNSMQWVNRFVSSKVAGTVDRTLGGSLVVFRASLVNGTPITLEAQEQTGWLRWDEVSVLMGWAEIADPSIIFELSFFGEVYDVLFAHFDGQAVAFKQLQSRQQVVGGWFTGSIKMYTV